jgi:hypothetical protein
LPGLKLSSRVSLRLLEASLLASDSNLDLDLAKQKVVENLVESVAMWSSDLYKVPI